MNSKRIKPTCYGAWLHVEIPDERGISFEEPVPRWQRIAKEFEESVRKHCDARETEITLDLRCPLCGRTWELDEDGIPACCNDARDSFLENPEANPC